MKKLLHCIVASFVAGLLITGVSFAGARTGDRDGTPDQDQDRDRDGSCLDAAQQESGKCPLFVSNGRGTGDRDGTPDRDQARDGSCRES